MEPISSPRNPKVVAAGRLHRARARKIENATLIEGPHAVGDAIAAGATIETIFVVDGDADSMRLAGDAGISPVVVTEAVLSKLAATKSPAGPVAVVAVPPSIPFPSDRSVLVMVDVADPGNVGTLIRTAEAFGFAVSVDGGADIWSPKVLRAGAGSHFRTPICEAPPNVSEISQTTVATVVAGGVATVNSGGPYALYVGSEPHGLPEGLEQAADIRLTIPMAPTTESLNVSVAGGIAMYLLANGDRP